MFAHIFWFFFLTRFFPWCLSRSTHMLSFFPFYQLVKATYIGLSADRNGQVSFFLKPHQLDAQYDRGAPTYEPLNYCRAKSEQDIQTDATVENCRILLYLHTIYHKIRIASLKNIPRKIWKRICPSQNWSQHLFKASKSLGQFGFKCFRHTCGWSTLPLSFFHRVENGSSRHHRVVRCVRNFCHKRFHLPLMGGFQPMDSSRFCNDFFFRQRKGHNWARTMLQATILWEPILGNRIAECVQTWCPKHFDGEYSEYCTILFSNS